MNIGRHVSSSIKVAICKRNLRTLSKMHVLVTRKEAPKVHMWLASYQKGKN